MPDASQVVIVPTSPLPTVVVTPPSVARPVTVLPVAGPPGPPGTPATSTYDGDIPDLTTLFENGLV